MISDKISQENNPLEGVVVDAVGNSNARINRSDLRAFPLASSLRCCKSGTAWSH